MKKQTKTYRQQIENLGKTLARLLPDSKVLPSARDWWKTGNLYSNHDFDVLQSLRVEIQSFEKGYRDGYNDREMTSTDYAYDAGWDAGNCDRPSLDELLPMDVAKERSTRCLD